MGKDEKGSYTLPVMNKINAMTQRLPFIVMAFDWAGSTNAYPADEAAWEELTHLCEEWTKQRGAAKMKTLSKITEVVKKTQWFASYKGQIKGNVKSYLQSSCNTDTEIQLACIEGGPISRVEQLELPSIKEELLEDLQAMGIVDRDIRIITYPSFQVLEDTMNYVLSSYEEDAGRKSSPRAQKGWDSWSAAEVGAWITSQGHSFEQHGRLFVENDITGSELKDLDEETLEELGVNKLFRKRILKKLLELTSSTTSITATQQENSHVSIRNEDKTGGKDVYVADRFRQAVSAKYQSADAAFDAMDLKRRGFLSRTDFKRVMTLLGLGDVSEADRATLRRQLDSNNDKKVVKADFVAFLTTGAPTPSNSAQPVADRRVSQLLPVPLDVPSLPDGYRPREANEGQLKSFLMDRNAEAVVLAQGMGGVGKSCIAARIARSTPIRQHFRDGIAWATLGQTPDLLALGKRLHMQLLSKPMPPKCSTVELQHQAMQQSCIGRAILVILDDVWSADHLLPFDVIDRGNTQSKILASSRISGLVEANEVALSLMPTDEAVELVTHVAGMDGATPAVLEVVRLCGRLPLCLRIAGRIICESIASGEDWQDEILPEMRSDLSQFMGDAGGLSVQETIISSSLNSITGHNADKIKELFFATAVYQEDQCIPVKVMEVLHAAVAKIRNTKKSKFAAIRKWVNTLVGRSLLMQLARNTCCLHDIVRDFVLSQSKDNDEDRVFDLLELQQTFLELFIASQDTWTAVADLKDRHMSKGRELEWFISELSLRWHIKAACTHPLVENKCICASLTHSSSLVVREVLACLEFEQAVAVAEHFGATDQKEAALSLSAGILEWCGMPRSVKMSRGHSFLADLDNAASDVRARFAEREVNICQIVLMTAVAGSDGSQAVMDRMSEIVKSRLAQLSPLSQSRVLRFQGMTLAGMLPHLRPSVEQAREGAVILRKVDDIAEAAWQTGEVSHPPTHYVFRSFVVYHSICGVSCDCWSTPWSESEKSRFTKRRAMECHELYDYQFHDFFVNVYLLKFDPFIRSNLGLPQLSIRIADLEGAAANIGVWQDSCLRALAAGEQFGIELGTTCPILLLLRKCDVLQSVFVAYGVDLETAEGHFKDYTTESTFVWDVTGCRHGGDFMFHPVTMGMIAQLQCFLMDPTGVSPSEMLECIPEPDACPCLEDRMHNRMTWNEPLGVGFAKAASEIGEGTLAMSHARRALASLDTPVKAAYAKAAVAFCSSS